MKAIILSYVRCIYWNSSSLKDPGGRPVGQQAGLAAASAATLLHTAVLLSQAQQVQVHKTLFVTKLSIPSLQGPQGAKPNFERLLLFVCVSVNMFPTGSGKNNSFQKLLFDGGYERGMANII